MKIYSNILKKIILPVMDKFMQTRIMGYYSEIKEMNTWEKAEIDKWQQNKIQQLIHHAYNNTTYYRELFDENNINPAKILNKEDLDKIPVLTKEIIKKNYKKLIPGNISTIPYTESATGGSTGIPLKYLLDKRSWSFCNANNIVNWERSEYQYGNRYIALGSSSLSVDKAPSLKHALYYKLKNKIGLNGINLSDEVCKNYIDIIKEQKVKYIYGYASAIYLLAKFVLREKISVDIRACFSTSEILTEHYYDTIIKAFNCKIVNCYGANDGGITAFDHIKGSFEVSYNSIVRVQDPDKNNVGSIFLTDLFNYAMPFINYSLEDEVEMAAESNNDYNGQVIKKVHGRSSDIIRLDNGRILTGPGFTILFKDLPVESYQIEKTSGRSLKCLIKKSDLYRNSDEELILNTLKRQAGADTEINIVYTDKFEISKSGKRKYFITD